MMLAAILALAVTVGPFHGCPAEGDNKVNQRTRALDVLKNRSNVPTTIDVRATLDEVIRPFHDDRARWKEGAGASFTGYVVLVGLGGRETANCHATAPALTDTHVELALSPSGRRPHTVVTEVTPRWREAMRVQGIDWSTAALRKLVGKKVTVTGWLMLDLQHVSQSENTHHPGSTANWRQTAWEIHPITSIVIGGSE